MNINSLKESLTSLEDAQEKYSKNKNLEFKSIFADSCIKRFEYTLETAIKLMRKILKNEYAKDESDLTVNNIFRLMDSYGFIRSWNVWKNYYQQRNNTVHKYNIEKSRDLLKLIPNFIKDCRFLMQKLDDKFQQEPYFQIISTILQKYTNQQVEFYAYGSRIKGTFQKNSDLDVLIKGNISAETLEIIKEEIDKSDIPFIVHFSEYQYMDKNFYESIKENLLKL